VEIRRQFDQAYALVSAAKQRIDARVDPTANILLDMAEDVLGELKYINRIDPPDASAGGAS
jgi:hypothetical protein